MGRPPTGIRGDLIELTADLSRLSELKKRGIEALPEFDGSGSLKDEVGQLLSELADEGVFLVRVGELESWLPTLMNGVSREDKARWAMLAAEKIEVVGEREEDVWAFIRGVDEHLQRRVGELATESQTRD